ncbi:hypothetical protein H7Y40_02995 [Pedobacter sp.]|nr:hypothetical protein [Candidatus Saccharibacteria bacterium]
MNDDFKSSQPVTSVVDEPTPQVTPPVQKPIVEKKKYSKAFSFVSVLLLLVILGAGVLAYFWYNQSQELTNLKSQNTDLKTDIENQRAQNPGKEDATPTLKQTESELAESAAFRHSCVTVGAPCSDKVIQKVIKIQEPVFGRDGFAIVSMTDGDGANGAKYYLKSSNLQWEVIYDGQNTPPADVVKKFAIPADFL